MAEGFLTHPILEGLGVEHGFGLRGTAAPHGCVRVAQVHGAALACVGERGELDRAEADAVLSHDPHTAVSIVTADCVPILAARADGSAVVAIHAGWRGIAAGVIEAGIGGLRAGLAADARLCAVVGPHIGACCYEVDARVLAPLGARFGAAVDHAITPTRPGHHHLELAVLVFEALRRLGVEPAALAEPGACTACDDARFESYRRDGATSGRLVHYVRPRMVGPRI